LYRQAKLTACKDNSDLLPKRTFFWDNETWSI
jgi:hypothetical protein